MAYMFLRAGGQVNKSLKEEKEVMEGKERRKGIKMIRKGQEGE